jgi:hypothetical protein
MKPTRDKKKTETKTGEKEGEKGRAIKKLNKKGGKAIKN